MSTVPHFPMLIVSNDHRILGKLFAIANTRRAANNERYQVDVAQIPKSKKRPILDGNKSSDPSR